MWWKIIYLKYECFIIVDKTQTETVGWLQSNLLTLRLSYCSDLKLAIVNVLACGTKLISPAKLQDVVNKDKTSAVFNMT